MQSLQNQPIAKRRRLVRAHRNWQPTDFSLQKLRDL